MRRNLLLFALTAPLFLSAWGKEKKPAAPPPPRCPERALLVSARPCPSPEKPYTVSASFLLWQAKLWGLEFAGKSFLTNTPGAALQTFNQKIYFPDFAWRPGFRIQAGGFLPYGGWAVQPGWTYYHDEFTSLKKHIGSQIAPAGLGVIPLWRYPFFRVLGGNSGDPIRYRSAAGNWKMFLNSIDASVGRLFFPNGSLPTRFYAGAKAAWIRQRYHADYSNGNAVDGYYINFATVFPNTFQLNSSRFEFTSGQWGIGPKAGLETRWNLAWGFRLIANGDLSVLCSFYNLHHEYADSISEPAEQLSHASMESRESFRELTPILGAMLGLDWAGCFCHLHMNFTVGYEYQYWGSINHVRRNYVQSLPGETFDMRGDLQMQGLTASMKFDF